MEWLGTLLQPGILVFLIPIIAIILAFTVSGLKAYFAHVERMEKIRSGIDPDRAESDNNELD